MQWFYLLAALSLCPKEGCVIICAETCAETMGKLLARDVEAEYHFLYMSLFGIVQNK